MFQQEVHDALDWWVRQHEPGRLEDHALRTNPLGVAWRQYKAGVERAVFAGPDIIRVVALVGTLRALSSFPTKSKYGVIRDDDHFQREMLRRSTLSAHEFDAVEFESIVAFSYLHVIRAPIMALEPADKPRPDFEVFMSRPVAIEAKARASYTPQDERIGAAITRLCSELTPALDALSVPLALRISTKSEPSRGDVDEAVRVGRELLSRNVPVEVKAGVLTLTVDTLGKAAQEYASRGPTPHGMVPHAAPPLRAYLQRWSPVQSKRDHWSMPVVRAHVRREGDTIYTSDSRVLLVQVMVTPDHIPAVSDLVHQARKQLPKDQAGAIFMRATPFFAPDQSSRLWQGIAKELRSSERIGAIAAWHQAVETVETANGWDQSLRWQIAAFQNDRARHPLPPDFTTKYLPNGGGFEMMNPRVAVRVRLPRPRL